MERFRDLLVFTTLYIYMHIIMYDTIFRVTLDRRVGKSSTARMTLRGEGATANLDRNFDVMLVARFVTVHSLPGNPYTCFPS